MKNEKLFSNKESLPNQVAIRTQALLHSLQLKPPKPPPIKTITFSEELAYTGPKIFVDAAWRNQTQGHSSKAGLGIYITWQHNS
jgi:hypothetical protein